MPQLSELQTLFLKNLRSGDFTQATEALRSGDYGLKAADGSSTFDVTGHCCLGVALETVMRVKGWGCWKGGGFLDSSGDEQEAHLTREAANALELKDLDPILIRVGDTFIGAMVMNDGGSITVNGRNVNFESANFDVIAFLFEYLFRFGEPLYVDTEDELPWDWEKKTEGAEYDEDEADSNE